MKKNLWITIPVSLLCLSANAASTTTTTRVARPAQAAAPGTSTAQAPATTTATAPTAAKPAATATKMKMKAPTAATSTVKAPAKKEEPASLGFSLIFDTNHTIGAAPNDEGVRSESHDFSLIPGMSYGDYSTDVTFTYEQDMVDSSASPGFYDPAFGFYRKAWELNKYFKLSPSISLILPMSDSSKNNVGLMYNVGAGLKLALNTKTLGWDNWSFNYNPSYTRNFTTYDTKLNGDPNTLYRIRNRFNMGYSFTDKLSLSLRFQLDSNYSVEGIVRNNFLHYQYIAYAITDNVEVNVGHTNSAGLLKPATYENNLKFYDETSSTYSAGMTISI